MRPTRRMVTAGTKMRRLFVPLRDAGIHPADGLTVTFFGSGRCAYVRVDEALAWLEREQPHHPSIDEYRRALKDLSEGRSGPRHV